MLAIAQAVLTTQRDHGDRTNRKHARLKYTLETMGIAAFRAEVEARAGLQLAPSATVTFKDNGDPTQGWHTDDHNLHHYVLYVPSGRVSDTGEWRALSGLRAVAQRELAQFRLSANQNLVLSDIAAHDRDAVAGLLHEYGLSAPLSPVRHLTLACVGLPTCGLAMAESERYAPSFISEIEALLAGHGLAGTPINIRITGCPNGCARPFLAEIALVGKAPGRYNLYLGGAADGSRLTGPYRDNIPHAEILALLDLAFGRYAETRTPGERFGDFVIRAGIVDPVASGPEFSVAVQKLTGT